MPTVSREHRPPAIGASRIGVACGPPEAADTRHESQFMPFGVGRHSVHCAHSNRQGVGAGFFCPRGFPWVILTTSFKTLAGLWLSPRYTANPMMPTGGIRGAGGRLGGNTTHF